MLKLGLLTWGHKQAEFAAPPEDVSAALRPLFAAQVIHFAGIQAGAQVIAEMAEYAGELARRYGDRVDEWGTLNEPVNYLLAAYGIGTFPPGRFTISTLFTDFIPIVRDYLAAHAAMYDAIKANDTIDADGDGVAAAVGLTLSVADWAAAGNNQPSTDARDVAARDKVEYVYHYLPIDAITRGGFDADLDGQLDEEHPDWRGKLDWLGVQYYFRTGVTGQSAAIRELGVSPCFGMFDFGSCLPPADVSYCVPTMGYEFYAPGIHDVLVKMGARYPALPLVVSESGIATDTGARRAENIVRVLEQIDRAKQEGVDVRTGLTDGAFTEVSGEGLKEGDKVVATRGIESREAIAGMLGFPPMPEDRLKQVAGASIQFGNRNHDPLPALYWRGIVE